MNRKNTIENGDLKDFLGDLLKENLQEISKQLCLPHSVPKYRMIEYITSNYISINQLFDSLPNKFCSDLKLLLEKRTMDYPSKDDDASEEDHESREDYESEEDVGHITKISSIQSKIHL